MNFREEAEYRLSLAESSLRDSRKFREDKLYHWSVLSAQLSVENSAKAVISCFRTPSWVHDPSTELEDIINEQKEKIAGKVGEHVVARLKTLSDAAAELAPERGKATYGLIERRVPPSDIYDQTSATRALDLAEQSYETAQRFVKEWFT